MPHVLRPVAVGLLGDLQIVAAPRRASARAPAASSAARRFDQVARPHQVVAAQVVVALGEPPRDGEAGHIAPANTLASWPCITLCCPKRSRLARARVPSGAGAACQHSHPATILPAAALKAVEQARRARCPAATAGVAHRQHRTRRRRQAGRFPPPAQRCRSRREIVSSEIADGHEMLPAIRRPDEPAERPARAPSTPARAPGTSRSANSIGRPL